MSHQDHDLSLLMIAARSGDAVAYRRLLSLLSGRLRVVVRAGLRKAGCGTSDEEDIVQEALLAIHLKKHTWNEDQPLQPWVNAIARHKLVDSLRRRGVRAPVNIDEVADELPAPTDCNEGNVKECLELLVELPERQQKIVRYFSIEGLSAREVGEKLKMSEGAVRTALHRALKTLSTAYRRNRI